MAEDETPRRSIVSSLEGETCEPTQDEIDAVAEWLTENDGEWKLCKEVEEDLPFLRRFFKDEDERDEDGSIAAFYFVNDIATLAGLKGGIEEHGYDELFVCADLDNPKAGEDDEEE